MKFEPVGHQGDPDQQQERERQHLGGGMLGDETAHRALPADGSIAAIAEVLSNDAGCIPSSRMVPALPSRIAIEVLGALIRNGRS